MYIINILLYEKKIKCVTKFSNKYNMQSDIKSLKKLTKKLAKSRKKGYNNNRVPDCVMKQK